MCFWRCGRPNGFDLSANMAKRSFIVRYALFGVGFCEGVGGVENEIGAILKNLGVGSGKREDFGDVIGFDAISAQDICFFGVARGVAGKVGSMKVGKVTEGVAGGVSGGVSGEITGGFEGEIDSLGNAGLLGVGRTVSFGVGVSEGVDLGFFWW